MIKGSLLYIAIIFFLFGFYSKLDLLIGISFVLFFIVILSRIWVIVGQRFLNVTVKSEKIAYFQEDNFELSYSIENRSYLPFTNVRLIIAIHRKIKVENLMMIRNEGLYNYYQLNYTLPPRRTITKTITCSTEYRGGYYLDETYLIINDQFQIYETKIKHFPKKEIAIYPKVFHINNMKNRLSQLYGNKKIYFSLLEDRVLPKGAREYQSSDPFTKIDWKQTSKYSRLFTKQYEYTAHQEFWILANLNTSDDVFMGTSEEKVERGISTVASLAHHFSEKGLSYNILMNAKLVKRNELFRLSANKKHDLPKVLYQLAKLSSYITVNYIHTLHAIKDINGVNKPIIILVSSYLSKEVEVRKNRLKREGYKIIWIDTSDNKMEVDDGKILGLSAKISS